MANAKETSIIEFLRNCPTIRDNPLFFNFINAKDDNKQFVTVANDKATNRSFVDGSVEKQYSFTIIDFRSIAYLALPLTMAELETSENVEEYLDFQGVIDWVTEQADNKNFPDFGTDCIVDSMEATTENPNLNGVDTTTTPALAKYSVTVRITYIDTSKAVWKN